MAIQRRSATGMVVLIVSVVLVSCTGTDPAPTEDVFFTPRMRRHAEPPPAAFEAAARDALSRAGEIPSDALRASLRQQQDRLTAISRRLDALADSSGLPRLAGTPPISAADSVTAGGGSAWSLLTMIDEQSSRLEAALSRLESALAAQRAQAADAERRMAVRSPDDSRDLLNEAIREYRRGDFRSALARLSELRSRRSARRAGAGCDFWTGMVHFRLYELDRAKELFAEVARGADSRYANAAYLMLAQCYKQTGAIDLAGGMCRRVLEESPRSTRMTGPRINRSAPESIGGNLIRSAESSSLVTLHEASVR